MRSDPSNGNSLWLIRWLLGVLVSLVLAGGAWAATAVYNHFQTQLTDHENRLRAQERALADVNGKLDVLLEAQGLKYRRPDARGR